MITTTKALKLSVLLLAVTTVFYACGGGKNDPKAVAQDFLDALQKQDYAAAKKLATPESEEMLSTLESLSDMGGDAAKTEPKKVEISDVKEDGDNATVTYSVEGEEGDQSLELTKVDGEWKVVFGKEGMGGGDMDLDLDDMMNDTTDTDSMMMEIDSPGVN